MGTKQLSFVADDDMVALINELKQELKAPTTAAVFRKALAFAKLAAEEAKDSGGVVTIKGKGNPDDPGVSIALKA